MGMSGGGGRLVGEGRIWIVGVVHGCVLLSKDIHNTL